MSIHHFDLLRAATNRDVLRIHARGRRAPDSPFAHHPPVTALLDLEGDVPVLYEGDWATREAETSWNEDREVVGERPATVARRSRRPRRGRGPAGAVGRAAAQPGLDLTERAATLRDAVGNDRAPETVAKDNVKSLAVVLGCVLAVERGETVDVAGLLEAGQPQSSRRREG